jgi:magnesium chelatase subunit D
LTTVLACAAVEPSLHGLLLIDLPGQLLEQVAAAYKHMLEIRYGAGLRQVTLSSHQTDDDLWTSFVQRDEQGIPQFGIGRGALAGVEGQHQLLVVVIPDLARASLAVNRAIVELLGAPTAAVERHGISARWQPSPHWVAACAAADTGQVSPHVLDRFMLRLAVTQRAKAGGLAERLRADDTGEAQSAAVNQILSDLPARWRSALADPPTATISDSVLRRTAEWPTQQPGMRRQLGLARLARAIARLEGGGTVGPAHVDAAAELIGLTSTATVPGPIAVAVDADGAPPREAVLQQSGQETDSPAVHLPDSVPAPQPVISTEPEVLPAEPVRELNASPFPEDAAIPAREAAPLQIPAVRRRGQIVRTGIVIGTRPADELVDIAWVATAIEAAKYQKWRRTAASDSRLVIRGSDVRSYRRTPASEFLLGLLLDHTCGRDWDWIPPITPFLRWAYIHRATVCLVEVGSADAAMPLRAERAPVRGMVDPYLVTAMSRRPGKATPLADGLTKLHTDVRHSLQHGRGGVTEAIVVIATDGLGNVPLQASQNGEVAGLVRQEGVDDAVAAAAGLGELVGCRCVCVAPPWSAYRQHLERLAVALNAPIVTGAGASGIGEPRTNGGALWRARWTS